MRFAPGLALLAVLTVPLGLSAQDLKTPEDWSVRFDAASASRADLEMFVEMPPGWHVTSGPAAIYWGPGMEASGAFRVEMEVYLFDPGERREAFGIFLGGSNLESDAQEYTYFLIRNGGQFILKRREGAEAPTLQGWTGNDAIKSFADRGDGASVLNVLAIDADAETVRFYVNDAEVASLPRADVGVDGTFGFRVNHGLNLHISRIEIMPRP